MELTPWNHMTSDPTCSSDPNTGHTTEQSLGATRTWGFILLSVPICIALPGEASCLGFGFFFFQIPTRFVS